MGNPEKYGTSTDSLINVYRQMASQGKKTWCQVPRAKDVVPVDWYSAIPCQVLCLWAALFPDPSCGDLLGMSQKDLFSKDELSAIWRTNVFQSSHGKSEALKMHHNFFLNICQRKGLSLSSSNILKCLIFVNFSVNLYIIIFEDLSSYRFGYLGRFGASLINSY